MSDASSLEIEAGGSKDLPLRIRSLRLGGRDEANHDSGDGGPGRRDNGARVQRRGGTQVQRVPQRVQGSAATVATTGTGTFKATINKDDTEIEYELTFNNLESDVRQAHIHIGHPQNAGGDRAVAV